MATTINSMSVNLGMEASGFIDTAKISRAEARMLTKEIEAARTPTEQFAVAQTKLEKALESGAISQEVYNRLLDVHAEKARKASQSTVEHADGILSISSKLGNVVSGIRAGLDMVGGAIGAVVDKFEAFNVIAEQLDDTKDRAEKLGLTFNELGGLQFAAGRLGGAEAAETVGKAMGVLLKKGFVEPGESAVDAFRRAAGEVSGMATQTERAQRAAELFGKQGIELLAVLSAGDGEIGSLVEQWERTNGLTQQQLEFIGDYNDRLDDVKTTIGGIASIYVAELAPAGSVLVEQVLGLKSGFEGVRDNARLVVDYLVGSTGFAVDLLEVLKAAKNPINKNDMLAAIDFSTADKMLFELYEKRDKLERKAEQDNIARAISRKSVGNGEDFSDLIDGNKSQWDSFISERKDGFSDLIDGNKDAWDTFIKDRDEANKAVTKSIESAQRELDRKAKDAQRDRERIAKGATGSDDIEGYARFMAESTNRKLAESSKTDAKPTDEQLLAEAKRQHELGIANNKKLEEMKSLLSQQTEAIKENGFKRIR